MFGVGRRSGDNHRQHAQRKTGAVRRSNIRIIRTCLRRILVAVDGSESGFHALRQATSLARAEKGAIKIISVAPPHAGELSLVGVRQHVNDMIIAPHQKALDEALRISEPYGVPARTILEVGEPPDKIVETAEETHSDLIVVGLRGGNPAKTLLMGSIAARVIGFSAS